MMLDKFLTEKVKFQKLIKIDENGMPVYQKESYLQCYKKREKKVMTTTNDSVITQTIISNYYVMTGRVKAGDLIDGVEVYQVQKIKEIGLDLVYVK
ncbi:hypothetical protein B5E87_00190 [Massilimicrobiota sp. An142]|uniref:hypothetical protein n=1 Tax=Massilimicrobiota sp. An142 TaxID=1965564 RepID=UPI000B3A81DC|nr:hypothetical protein [Massilimicrobiota sp. An142]OUQ15025.1 hypothetical protein B5E87_00190 [Massilimicrobiota sp. An142]